MLALPKSKPRTPLRAPRWLLLLWLALLGAFATPAQDTQLTEADLKAAFLYNFAKFIDWPKDAFLNEESPIVVGIFGDEDFAATLRTLLQNKKAHGRAFVVRRVVNSQEAKNCQFLFFREAENRRLPQVLDTIRRLPILTVGESADFLDNGGMLNLFFEDKQLRFEVNPGPAETAKLNISSQLMRLAKTVRKGGGK
jgi:hypothetical protein